MSLPRPATFKIAQADDRRIDDVGLGGEHAGEIPGAVAGENQAVGDQIELVIHQHAVRSRRPPASACC
jgi:hypothetical protein